LADSHIGQLLDSIFGLTKYQNITFEIYLLSSLDINPFFRSLNFSHLICPMQNIPDLLQIKPGLRHQGGGINPFLGSFDNP
jgi:hypothetical protein